MTVSCTERNDAKLTMHEVSLCFITASLMVVYTGMSVSDVPQ